MSLSRFGDGEFLWMSGKSHESFQKYTPELGRRLCEVIKSDNPKLLLGFPKGMQDASICNMYAKLHWTIIREKYFPLVVDFLDKDKIYCDASITRPYIDYKNRETSRKSFENLRRIWCDKDIVIVEGEKTKLGLGNDLFDNAKSVARIVCPAENAFESIDSIENCIKKNVVKDCLILAALGPTATILASDMCREGYQVVDIGHIDVEYMWYLKGTILREPIEGKSVNESGNRECSNKYDLDEKYINSIIARV